MICHTEISLNHLVMWNVCNFLYNRPNSYILKRNILKVIVLSHIFPLLAMVLVWDKNETCARRFLASIYHYVG